MANIGVDILKTSNEKYKNFLEKNGISLFDLLRAAFERLCERAFKENKETYKYKPLPANKRKKLEDYITTHFKNKADFAEKAKLDLSVLVAIINNRRCGGAIVWKKINDTFETAGVTLPCDLKIKYKVAINFGK